jgi:hypothetical protein
VRTKKSAGGKRRTRWQAFRKLPVKTQAGIVAILVIGLSVMAMLIAGREPKPAVARNDSPNATRAMARSAAVVPAIADATGTTGSSIEPASSQAVTMVKPVTITGCLERDDDTFRLRDATGTNAPKARSWKTGFIKKGPAAIEIIDAAHRLKLTDLVGRRVSVTGVLVDREMRARSVQRIAPSCTTDSKVKI